MSKSASTLTTGVQALEVCTKQPQETLSASPPSAINSGVLLVLCSLVTVSGHLVPMRMPAQLGCTLQSAVRQHACCNMQKYCSLVIALLPYLSHPPHVQN